MPACQERRTIARDCPHCQGLRGTWPPAGQAPAEESKNFAQNAKFCFLQSHLRWYFTQLKVLAGSAPPSPRPPESVRGSAPWHGIAQPLPLVAAAVDLPEVLHMSGIGHGLPPPPPSPCVVEDIGEVEAIIELYRWPRYSRWLNADSTALRSPAHCPATNSQQGIAHQPAHAGRSPAPCSAVPAHSRKFVSGKRNVLLRLLPQGWQRWELHHTQPAEQVWSLQQPFPQKAWVVIDPHS